MDENANANSQEETVEVPLTPEEQAKKAAEGQAPEAAPEAPAPETPAM